MSLLAAAGAITNPVSAFDVENDITWHSLFWAEGTAMTALAYSDTDAVGTWPNETGETDLTEATNKPTFDVSNASFNNKPVLVGDGTQYMSATSWTSNPVSPQSVVAVVNATGDGNMSFLSESANVKLRFDLVDTSRFYAIYGSASSAATDIAAVGAVHGLVAQWSSAGNEKFWIDGVLKHDGNLGAGQFDSALWAWSTSGGGQITPMEIAFIGIYEGDITADGSWADMQSWVSDHYGVSI